MEEGYYVKAGGRICGGLLGGTTRDGRLLRVLFISFLACAEARSGALCSFLEALGGRSARLGERSGGSA